jgi:methylenetetrahydrofolate dehydrogenase (NADP+)/methenyltetrahydrofolate cyclohydrolase
MALILSGKEAAKQLTADTIERINLLKKQNICPKLAIVRIGEKLSDIRYENNAIKRCEQTGIETVSYHLDASATQDQVISLIQRINADATVHGCLILRPFPKTFDDALVRSYLAPEKDVDGITDASLAGVFTGSRSTFLPCTAEACLYLLDYNHIDVEGKNVTVIGASLVIGRPVAMEFLKREATISICHIKTKDVKSFCQNADIIVTAAGHPHLVTKDMVKPHQVILDVGINVLPDKTICGDVDFADCSAIVKAITPVPGGIGSLTTAILAKHVAIAAARTIEKK